MKKLTNPTQLLPTANLYKLPLEERLELLVKEKVISKEEAKLLKKESGLELATANRMVESVIGSYALPLGLATNFRVNGRDILVPMVIEEPSVIAGATYAAKLALPSGFRASSSPPVMTGQIQLINIKDTTAAIEEILATKKALLEKANDTNRTMVDLGGGALELSCKVLTDSMIVVNVDVDVRDAMGANTINTMAEAIAPHLESLTGGKARLRILTNLADKRLAKAEVEYNEKTISPGVVDGVVDAYKFACYDVYRACTHNKGIMNGIDALVMATGNDWRAVEAGAHAYASRSGKYSPLTKWSKTKIGNLHGEIELPLALGLVGGATKTHPLAQLSLKILAVKTAQELAEIAAAVGLAQNFAALRALSTEGIQRGHMKLHAKNIAVIAGAGEKEIDKIAEQMAEEKKVNVQRAKEILEELRKGG